MRLIGRVAQARTASRSLDLLAARARRGDLQAAAALRHRMSSQARQLALALGVAPREVPAVVRRALSDAVRDADRPYGSAVVAAVQRHGGRARTSARSTAPAAPGDLQRAVVVLCDVQGHSHDSAAALLGQPVADVVALHRAARADSGVDAPRESCRGWFLVSRTGDLTPPEQAAAAGHLEICRSCREALDARAAARRLLRTAVPVGGTAAGGVVATLSALGGGSVAAGTVAATTAAVLGAGALVAVAPPAAMTAPGPARPAAVSEPVATPPPAAPDAAPVPAVDPGVPDAAPATPAPLPAPVRAPAPPAVPAPSGSPSPAPLVELEVPSPPSLTPTSLPTSLLPPPESVTTPLADPLLGG